MLNELIDAIGYENILNELENQSANGLYIKIPLDRELNEDEDILFVKSKDDITAKNEKLFDWFKIRKRYSAYINSNKALVTGTQYKYPKVITTNQANGIRFNSDTLFNKSKVYKISFSEAFSQMIKEFCNVCGNTDLFQYYKKGINVINNNYNELMTDNNRIVINMYVDIDIDTYINNYNSYMSNKLLDGKLKDGQGIFSLFATSNVNKPHLFMRSNIHNNSSAFKTTIDKAEKLRNLKSYLMKNPKGNIKYKNGVIKYECKEGNILEYNYYPTSAYDIFEKENLYIGDYKIDSAYKFKYQVEQLIGKDKTNDVTMFKTLYEKYYNDVDNLSIRYLKNNYQKMIKNLYLIGCRDFKNEYKLKNIIDFNISTSDYFFNTNILKEFEIMKNNIINKIKLLKETKSYTIKSKEEYWYLVGTLVAYITSLSKSSNSTLRLRINYCNLNNIQQILQKLSTDFKRYCYDIDTNSRCVKIYSAILNYSENIKQVDKLKLQQGLFESDSIMYVKLEENKLNDEGEI